MVRRRVFFINFFIIIFIFIIFIITRRYFCDGISPNGRGVVVQTGVAQINFPQIQSE